MAWSTPKTNWIAGDGVTNVDMVRIEENIKVLESTGNSLPTTTGTAPTFAVTIADFVGLTAGRKITVNFHAATSAAATLNVNGLGAKSITKPGGGNPNIKVGAYTLVYNGTSFQLLGEGGEYGTAGAAQVLAPYTIGTDAGLVTGTIVSRDGNTAATAHDGTGTVGRLYMRPAVGYYDGNNDYTYVDDADFTNLNLAFGKTLFGLFGMNMGINKWIKSNNLTSLNDSANNASLVAHSGANPGAEANIETTPWSAPGTWTDRLTVASGAVGEIATNGTIFVATVSIGGVGRIYSSTDLITWTLRFTGSANCDLMNVSWGNGVFIATANRNNLYATSSNGTTWTERTRTFPTVDYLRRSRWVNNVGVICPVGYMTWYFSTTDGVTLTQRTSPAGQMTLPRKTKSSELFCYSNSNIYKTTNGVDWTLITPNIPATELGSRFAEIVYDNTLGLYFACHLSNAVGWYIMYTSPDFITWTENCVMGGQMSTSKLEIKSDATKALMVGGSTTKAIVCGM